MTDAFHVSYPALSLPSPEYWQMVQEREREEAQRAAMRKEIADRMYEKVKREMEDEMRR